MLYDLIICITHLKHLQFWEANIMLSSIIMETKILSSSVIFCLLKLVSFIIVVIRFRISTYKDWFTLLEMETYSFKGYEINLASIATTLFLVQSVKAPIHATIISFDFDVQASSDYLAPDCPAGPILRYFFKMQEQLTHSGK